MTRGMPVLPSAACGDCPCLVELRDDYGDIHYGCQVTRTYVHWTYRDQTCISDELAWRNVCAGLFAVCAYYADRYAQKPLAAWKGGCLRGIEDDCTCKWCKPVNGEVKNV